MNLYTFFKFPYKVKKEIIYTHTNIKYNFFSHIFTHIQDNILNLIYLYTYINVIQDNYDNFIFLLTSIKIRKKYLTTLTWIMMYLSID